MGYHILLHVRARVKPEFTEFIQHSDYLWMDSVQYHSLATTEEEWCMPNPDIPEAFRDVHRLWETWSYDWSFQQYEFNMETRQWAFTISNRAHRVSNEDYRRFMEHFVVHVTEHIEWCEIEHDDYGDMRYQYTDADFRRTPSQLTATAEPFHDTEQLTSLLATLTQRVEQLEEQVTRLTASSAGRPLEPSAPSRPGSEPPSVSGNPRTSAQGPHGPTQAEQPVPPGQ